MTQGQKIKTLRNQHGYSQELLAEKLGVSRQALAKWEADQSKPSSRNLIKLSELFEIPEDKIANPNSHVLVIVDTGKELLSMKGKWKFLIWAVIALLGFASTFALALYGRISGNIVEDTVFLLVVISAACILSALLPVIIAIMHFVYKDCKRRQIRPTFWVVISCTFLGLGYYLIRRDSLPARPQ